MPFIYGNYRELYDFLRKQSEGYVVSDRVWVQQIDLLNQCTTFTYKKIEIDNCEQKSAFVCEIGESFFILLFLKCEKTFHFSLFKTDILKLKMIQRKLKFYPFLTVLCNLELPQTEPTSI